MNRFRVEQSLSHIGETVREQLERLDITSAHGYLTGVREILEPLEGKVAGARDQLRTLVEKASVAVDTEELRSINDQVVAASCDLFLDMQSVPLVLEFCTTARDVIAERVLELARRELYFSGTYCKVPLSLLAVGSDGRKEQSLFTDQDYLFLHGEGGRDSAQSEEELSDYFGMLGGVFVEKLDKVGISRCSGGIMPVNDDWRGSMQQWQERLTVMFRFERGDWERNILNLIALMDTRFVCGSRGLGLGFGSMVRSMVSDNPQAIRHMARVVSSMKLSKGLLRRFIVEAEGIHKGEFNIKVLAWMPLVMCIRLWAVTRGIDETSTLQRITRLQSEGHLSDRMATDLTEAFHVITRHRILQQIKRFKRIIDDDCYLNPYELPNSERETLKTAIGAVEELQNLVRSRFSMVTSADRIITPER